eukprot:CAMPEP_0170629212 /NCGR_PEP_ID=MMETSP0224-20130122/33203_1 /TAXON_ID=285029 /ORGANISM="Togula jolla, Strain CCCM 725" /LENGTH=245 /DNA_ID=CAMNT_0010956901 /DNA_START=49 /DNA_END=781 /DNA_ORIENTATION=-
MSVEAYPLGNVDVLKLFPPMFTFWCLLLFAAPMLKMLSITSDVSIKFWLGVGPMLLCVVPWVLIGIGALLHKARRGPCKWAIVVSLIGGGACLGGISDVVLKQAIRTGYLLGARDCEKNTEKYEIEKAWQAANHYASSCTDSGIISRCPTYREKLAQNPYWRYLREVELAYGCGGWCQPAKSLWFHRRDVGDSCSSVVSEVLLGNMQRLSSQVFTFCLSLIAGTGLFLIMLGAQHPQACRELVSG